MAPGRKKGGRPLKHKGEPLSKTRSFRMRPRLDDLLQAAAVEASRTVSQEIEYRLETSFHDERMALALTGSDVGALLLRMFYSAMAPKGSPQIGLGTRQKRAGKSGQKIFAPPQTRLLPLR